MVDHSMGSPSRSDGSARSAEAPRSDPRAPEKSEARSGSPMREDGETDEETRVVRVANLTRIVNHKHLEEIFAHYGRVERVALERFRPDKADENGGDSSNLRAGFVEYERTGDAARAMSHMDGGQIDGKEVAVTRIRSVPRDAQRPGEHNFDRRDRDRVGGGASRGRGGRGGDRYEPGGRGRPRARHFGDHHDDKGRERGDDRGPDAARGRRDSRGPPRDHQWRGGPPGGGPPHRGPHGRGGSRDRFDRRGPRYPGGGPPIDRGYHRDGRVTGSGGFGRRRSRSPAGRFRSGRSGSPPRRGGGFRKRSRSRSRGGRRGRSYSRSYSSRSRSRSRRSRNLVAAQPMLSVAECM